MNERAFNVTTTYPFSCMIFALCRSAGVPIWNVDQLKTRRALLTLTSSETRPMSWLYAEGPVQSCPHLLMILLIQ